MNTQFGLFRSKITDLSHVDLSAERADRNGIQLWENEVLSKYLETVKTEQKAEILFGGYLERRAIYRSASQFQSSDEPRDIHLGIDFWTSASTPFYALWPGVIHSFQDNRNFHDYGPTLIVCHQINGESIHVLYGHLSQDSMSNWKLGNTVAEGDFLGRIGAEDENGNWPPHLHLQFIRDMEGWQGDYPGVCALSQMSHYRQNCPDPAPCLGLE
jgi:hypothetical protein